jgi:hypothetical protein
MDERQLGLVSRLMLDDIGVKTHTAILLVAYGNTVVKQQQHAA